MYTAWIVHNDGCDCNAAVVPPSLSLGCYKGLQGGSLSSALVGRRVMVQSGIAGYSRCNARKACINAMQGHHQTLVLCMAADDDDDDDDDDDVYITLLRVKLTVLVWGLQDGGSVQAWCTVKFYMLLLVTCSVTVSVIAIVILIYQQPCKGWCFDACWTESNVAMDHDRLLHCLKLRCIGMPGHAWFV
jgi:hypothetical protein